MSKLMTIEIEEQSVRSKKHEMKDLLSVLIQFLQLSCLVSVFKLNEMY